MLYKKKVEESPLPVREKISPKEIHKSYLSKIEHELKDMGVVSFDTSYSLHIDQEHLVLPPDITNTSSRELGELLNAFTQQKVYMRTLLGRVEIQVEDAKRKLYSASKDLYKQLTKEKVSESAKERIISTDYDTSDAYDNYMDYKRKQSSIEYSIQNIEDIVFMLSREVTRRNSDFANESRNESVSRY